MNRQRFRNPAHILWVIRQGRGADWAELCRSLGLEPDDRFTAFGMVMDALRSLSRAGLITIGRRDDVADDVAAMTFTVTAAVREIQTALRVSLTQLAFTDPSTRLVVDPALDQTFSSRYRSDLFVLMPFLPELRPIYDNHIKVVGERLGMTITRADDFFTAGHIIEEVWTAIVAAKVIVADCTGRNPNVFYEIGLAHAIGKPVILIARNEDDVPFDLRHRRWIRYEPTENGMREFEAALQKTIQTIRSEEPGGDADDGSPSHESAARGTPHPDLPPQVGKEF